MAAVFDRLDMFTCPKLPGSPRLMRSACAARWRRAGDGHDYSEGRAPVASLDVCRYCALGAQHAGEDDRAHPSPATLRPPAPPSRAQRRRQRMLEIVLDAQRVMSTAELRDILAQDGQPPAPKVVAHGMWLLWKAGKVAHVAHGVYAAPGIQPPEEETPAWAVEPPDVTGAARRRRRAAVTWVASQRAVWRPRGLVAHLKAGGHYLGEHPFRTVNSVIRRLVDRGYVIAAPGRGRYRTTAAQLTLPMDRAAP